MQKRYILVVLIIIFGIFLYTGNRNAEQTVSIGDCSGKFYKDNVTVTSDLCAKGKTCIAKPEDQQNNAVVDVVLCACAKAKSGNYADASMNGNIENLTKSFFGYTMAAKDLCDQPVILTKRNYG